MPTYGTSKNRNMARSVLPATRRAALQSRRTRSGTHHVARTAEHRHLRQLALATKSCDPDELDAHPADADRRRQVAVGQLVSRRRGGDKLAPFIRWAKANAQDLGAGPSERITRLTAILPDGIIGRHAVSHLGYQIEFDPNPLTSHTTWRREYEEKSAAQERAVQRRYERVRCLLIQSIDLHGELNRRLKDDRCQNCVEWPLRLLAGQHDIDLFLADTWQAGSRCARRIVLDVLQVSV